MAVKAIFPGADVGRGMYESFYLRAVAPDGSVGVWLRYTVHKRPGEAPRGSVWCTVFDAVAGPLMYKHTTEDLTAPAGGWIAIGPDSRLAPGVAEGSCGQAGWSLRFASDERELRHLPYAWMYRAPLPRTKLTSPAPAASFDGTIELSGPRARTLDVRGWRGMVGHNWGSEHAERWIWLHGIGFDEDPSAWLDVAIGRVLVGGRMTPWVASGAFSLDGRRVRLGGLLARGLRVAEAATRCALVLPGESGSSVEAHVEEPAGTAAGWLYADPVGPEARAHRPREHSPKGWVPAGAGRVVGASRAAGGGRVGEHDVVNCSIASLTLCVHRRGEPTRMLHSSHGGAYELGMRERDHGVPLAPFSDG
jgi:hypothetical protein